MTAEEFTPMEVLEFLRKQASKGGKLAAKRMTKAQRVARAKKAAKASAKVRSAKAKRKG
jgi:hypothetical protein